VTFWQILVVILQGANVTIEVAAIGLLYAIPFALIMGILQHFSSGVSYVAVTGLIEFWRSTPVLILLFVFYYTLPTFGIYLGSLVVASMVLGLNTGGYGSQAVRAALQALDPGQVEAGRALGFRRSKILFLIELPQAFAAMTPTFVNQFIQLVKATALVSLITMTDMTFRAKQLGQTYYDPSAVYSGLLVAYLVICYPATIAGRWLEHRFPTHPRGRRGL
jgi:polar amino acid transport system permease protein